MSRSMNIGEGQLDSERVAHLLEAAEAGRLTAHVWFETELGVGQVDFFRGRVVGASIGPVSGRAALTRLLSLSEGRYRVVREAVGEGPPLVPSVRWLLDERARRQTQWRWLCEQAPSMSSVMALTQEGRKARGNLHGTDRLVLPLADGHRTLADLLTESNIDPVEALTSVVGAVESGLLSETEQCRSLFPLSPKEHVPHSLPGPARLPSFDEEETLRASQARPVRADVSSDAEEPANKRLRISTRPVLSVGGTTGRPRRQSETAWDQDGIVGASDRESAPSPSVGDSLQVLSAPSAEPSTARHVGLYDLLLRISALTASVYVCRLAAERGFGWLFALKLAGSRATREHGGAEELVARARMACRLNHPNVVRVVATGLHNTRPYLVMDYVEGASLERLLTRAPHEATVCRVLTTIVDALSGLHAMHELTDEHGLRLEVVHGRVSPESLLVGVDGRCRLTGLGVPLRARAAGHPPIAGQPGFSAPEQLQNRSLDRRMDVFAMAAVLWSALTGQRLFSGRSVEDTVRQVCNGAIAPPSQVGLRPPAALDWICLKALERDPDKRFATAQQMARALREVAADHDLLASADEVATWVRIAVGRELAQRRLLILDAARTATDQSIGRHDSSGPGWDEHPR